MRKSWKMPDIKGLEQKQNAQPRSSAIIVDSHTHHNKFKEEPNAFKFNMNPRFKYIYTGMSKQFWEGYHSPPEKVFCHIEEALSHRANSLTMYEKAYVTKEQVDAYMNDPNFKLNPMHPDHQSEPFKLVLKGADPRIHPNAEKNVKNLLKRLA